jgi:hypothetical protein
MCNQLHAARQQKATPLANPVRKVHEYQGSAAIEADESDHCQSECTIDKT